MFILVSVATTGTRYGLEVLRVVHMDIVVLILLTELPILFRLLVVEEFVHRFSQRVMDGHVQRFWRSVVWVFYYQWCSRSCHTTDFIFTWSRSVIIGNSYYLWVIWYEGNSTAVNGNYAYSLGGVAYITLNGRGVFQFTTLPVISISPILTVVRMIGNI